MVTANVKKAPVAPSVEVKPIVTEPTTPVASTVKAAIVPVKKIAIAAAKAPAVKAKPAPAKATKAPVKVATKTAAKPVSKSTPKPVVKAAIKPVTAKAASKPAVKVAPKPAVKSIATPTVKPVKVNLPIVAKLKKPKLVRDSFTIPEDEYEVLGQIKKTLLAAGVEVKKSQLLRVGLVLLKKSTDASLKKLLSDLAPLKAGRPKKEK